MVIAHCLPYLCMWMFNKCHKLIPSKNRASGFLPQTNPLLVFLVTKMSQVTIQLLQRTSQESCLIPLSPTAAHKPVHRQSCLFHLESISQTIHVSASPLLVQATLLSRLGFCMRVCCGTFLSVFHQNHQCKIEKTMPGSRGAVFSGLHHSRVTPTAHEGCTAQYGPITSLPTFATLTLEFTL